MIKSVHLPRMSVVDRGRAHASVWMHNHGLLSTRRRSSRDRVLLIRMKALDVILILLSEYVDEGSTDGRVLREDPQ